MLHYRGDNLIFRLVQIKRRGWLIGVKRSKVHDVSVPFVEPAAPDLTKFKRVISEIECKNDVAITKTHSVIKNEYVSRHVQRSVLISLGDLTGKKRAHSLILRQNNFFILVWKLRVIHIIYCFRLRYYWRVPA